MNIVYITNVAPWPSHSGAAIRTAAIHDTLARHSLRLRIVVMGKKPSIGSRSLIHSLGGKVFPARLENFHTKISRGLNALFPGRSLHDSHLWNARRVGRLIKLINNNETDVVVLGNTYFAALIPELKRYCPNVRFVVDNHNVESLLSLRIIKHSSDKSTLARCLVHFMYARRLERRYLQRADQVWACSEHDAHVLRSKIALKSVEVVPNVVDVQALKASVPKRETSTSVTEPVLVYIGMYSYPPNADAAHQLIDLSYRLRSRGVHHRLQLVGRNPTPSMKQRANGSPHILITGNVPKTTPYLNEASLVVAPLRSGSGTKFKLLQAMAMGKPVITTKIGAEGLDITDGIEAVICKNNDDFEQRLIELLENPGARQSLGRNASKHVARYFDVETLDALLPRLMTTLFEEEPIP